MPGERQFKFYLVDVFSKRPLEGNQLAVFLDAEGLSDREMQSIAREMRLSETTFVFPRDERTKNNHFRTRIFTTQEELPFAGHPTLGTSWVLRKENPLDEIVLELNVGAVPVRFSKVEEDLFGEMTQPEPKFGMVHPTEKVASALGVQTSDLDLRFPIETVSTGVPFAIVPFRTLGVLRNLRPDVSKMQDYLGTSDARSFYLVSRETQNPNARAHARMIFYSGEDPATGSGAGTATAWMLGHGWIKAEEQTWIEQGLEISRPSQIFVRAGGDTERPSNIRVGGFCYGGIEGELRLPSSS